MVDPSEFQSIDELGDEMDLELDLDEFDGRFFLTLEDVQEIENLSFLEEDINL